MIEDGRRLEHGTELEADIAIVGAGIAGLALALSIARIQPRTRIVVVEGGGRRYDFRDQLRYFAGNGETHPRHAPLELYRRRMLGGTGSIWGGRCIPMSPDDFLPRPDLGRDGWPIAYEEVARHYPEALEFLEAGASEFDARDALPGEPAELAPLNEPNGLVLTRIERFSPPTDPGRRYLAELEASNSLTVLLNAACTGVLTDAAGNRAEGLALRCADKDLTVSASRVVIAAGGLETPRLLLWSRRAKRCGLGNGSGQVGRNYLCHYVGDLGRIRFAAAPERLNVGYSKSHDGVWCRRLMLLDDRTRRDRGLVNFVLRPTIPAIHDPGHGSAVLSATHFAKRFLIAEYARRLAAMPAGEGAQSSSPLAAHALNLLRGLPDLAGFAASWTRQRVLPRRKIPSLFLTARDGAYPLEFNMEELPSPQSRVRLGNELDPNGMPRLELSWRVAPDVPGRLAAIYDSFAQSARASGLGEVTLTAPEREQISERCHAQGGHHMGTARMSKTPSAGVVGPNLEVWGTRGLYVLGSAVFPTSGFANPTLTIAALALRLAEHLTGRSGAASKAEASLRMQRMEPAE